MASESLAIEVTKSAEFHFIPRLGANVFSVREGIEVGTATGVIECIDEAVHELLTDGVGDGEMSAAKLWLVRFALEASSALRNAGA